MRAKIAYTVDLEEIPTKTSKLISESSSNLQDISEELNDISINLVADKETLASIKKIDTLRQRLFKIDNLLQDTSNILIGYEKTLLGMSEIAEEQEVFEDEIEEG